MIPKVIIFFLIPALGLYAFLTSDLNDSIQRSIWFIVWYYLVSTLAYCIYGIETYYLRIQKKINNLKFNAHKMDPMEVAEERKKIRLMLGGK